MSAIRTAILLAAGEGPRLRRGGSQSGEGTRLRGAAAIKPLCPVAGRPLIDHALDGLAAAGMERVVVVLGYQADRIEAHLAARALNWVETVRTPDYRQPNGVSALAARTAVEGEALLAMCDHLAETALYTRVAEAGAGAGLRLGVDRATDNPWLDMDDVTRVRTADNRIVAIGKGIEPYDCFDTGVFAVGPALFESLASLAAPSLSEGVDLLARRGQAEVVDCTGLAWIDVDDPVALAWAEQGVALRPAI